MQETSDLYKELLADDSTVKEVKVIIDGEEYLQDRLISVGTSGGVFNDDVFSVGGTRSREIDILLRDAGNIPRMAKMEVFIRLINPRKCGTLVYTNIPSDSKLSVAMYYDFTYRMTGRGGVANVADKVEIQGKSVVLDTDTSKRIEVFSPSHHSETYQEEIEQLSNKYLYRPIVLGSVWWLPDGVRYEWEYESDIGANILYAYPGEKNSPQLVTAEPPTVSEWIKKGTFYIDTRKEDYLTGDISIHGFDAMLKAEQQYITTVDQGMWPAKDLDVIEDIANRMEIGVYPRTVETISEGFLVQYPGYGSEAYTMREMLGFIGAMYAGNWVISDKNELQLINLKEAPSITNAQAKKALQKSTSLKKKPLLVTQTLSNYLKQQRNGGQKDIKWEDIPEIILSGLSNEEYAKRIRWLLEYYEVLDD